MVGWYSGREVGMGRDVVVVERGEMAGVEWEVE